MFVRASPDLRRLRERAIADPRAEPTYLRALLGATLYAHLPLSDDSGRTRLIAFTRPDGLTVIPMFTELRQAQAAAATAARIVAATGRQLFEATRGGIVMLDPNEVGMTLYPEEIAALLDDGRLAPAPVAFHAPGLRLVAPPAGDEWLLDVLADAFAAIPEVHRFHLAGAGMDGGDSDRLLVLVAAPDSATERLARALGTALQAVPRTPSLPIDLGTYSEQSPLDEMLRHGLPLARSRTLPGR